MQLPSLPRQHAVAAIRAVAQLGAQLAPQLLISEVRSIAADALWMSMCHNAFVDEYLSDDGEWKRIT